MATATQIRVFIEKLGALAIAESNRRIAAGEGFVLPSVCIAQAALETGWGTSGLMTRANAYFGIKAGGSWTGSVYTAGTWEVANGEAYNTTANFRAYNSPAESVADYYDLIGHSSRYKNALSYGRDRSTWKTAQQCITAIWSGGYATDTLYVEKIMNTINARSLTEYDTLVTGQGEAPISTQTSILFDYDDLVQGKLILADSGRSIARDATDLNCICVSWNKAKEVDEESTLTVYAPEGATFYLCYTSATRAFIEAYQTGDTVTLDPGVKVGFYLQFSEETLIEDFNKDIQAGLTSGLPAGLEAFKGVIAHFVKI